MDADSMNGHAIMALEDDSEYHCITPRDEIPRFWEREVFTLKAGQHLWLKPRQHLYSAGKGRPPSMLVNSDERDRAVWYEKDATVALMWWCDEPTIQA